jgi:hypothetical protein
MRSVAKYLETAVEFDELASLISEPASADRSLKQMLSARNSCNPFAGPRCDLAGYPLIPLMARR